jgi:hypothetical protein
MCRDVRSDQARGQGQPGQVVKARTSPPPDLAVVTGQYGVLREVAGRAEAGSDGWCAVQLRIILAALFCFDLAGMLEHATALRDAAAGRGPSRALADGLFGRAVALDLLGRVSEAAKEARRSLAVARDIGYLAGEILALSALSFAARGGYSRGRAETRVALRGGLLVSAPAGQRSLVTPKSPMVRPVPVAM